ncbi:hypothetical protein KFL_008360020 [Klebsormidium nitens]|uniref:DNA primase/polymerase bifunctional N-terminal domain-containing protein n=1 Tax=Klebsormidium nitens TaxID=105231 RepID=A0A1Y1ILM2_KLENI|nr:hypothetical protein KFL_008360020 [Klebsormidium nitens]|eukprot:GAQ91694.1 hypothetical protein KFL_008360020 [Klebsormidium nitens]
MAEDKQLYLDEDPIKVPGIHYSVISFLTPKGPQKCDTFGVKIRGSFDTYDQANAHAQRLAKVDPAFDIYVVDCYRWLTAAPDPNLLDKKVYNNPTLNTLMESYQQEQERAKQLFEERKAKLFGVLLVLGGVLIYTTGSLRVVRGARARLQALPERMDAATAALRAADSATQAAKAAAPKNTVQYLPTLDMFFAGNSVECGFSGIPVNITLKNGKKVSSFPRSYAHLTTVESWKQHIDGMIASHGRNCNSIAVLTGISDCYVLDIDTTSDSTKQAGMELWNRLVFEHGEPNTLRAKTGSGGLHFYFSVSQTPRLKRTRNFSGVKVDGHTYGIDGRGKGGVIFCPPSSYTDEHGTRYSYFWEHGEPRLGCNGMPDWLTDLVNAQGGAALPDPDEAPGELQALPLQAGPSALQLPVDRSIVPRGEPAHYDLASAPNALIVSGIRELLFEKAGDRTSRCSSTLDHGPFGTFYCFRVSGPRICFLGQQHDGANNFNVLKQGKRLLYRCHGTICSHEKVRPLGNLPLEVALMDASSEAVDDASDDSVFNFRTMSSNNQALLLRLLAEKIRENYTGLGQVFAYVYAKEGRILVTDPKRTFYFWDSKQWMRDDGGKVQSTFCVQMARLLRWYDRQRDALLKRKLIEVGACQEDEPMSSVIAAARRSDARVKKAEAHVEEELPRNKVNVLMVGGSSRVLPVQSSLRKVFGEKVEVLDRPEEAVARGAALMASISEARHRMEIVLPAGTPFGRTKSNDNCYVKETSFEFTVLPGNRDDYDGLDECIVVKQFQVKRPKWKKGGKRIFLHIEFHVMMDGGLSVRIEPPNKDDAQECEVQQEDLHSRDEQARRELEALGHRHREEQERLRAIEYFYQLLVAGYQALRRVVEGVGESALRPPMRHELGKIDAFVRESKSRKIADMDKAEMEVYSEMVKDLQRELTKRKREQDDEQNKGELEDEDEDEDDEEYEGEDEDADDEDGIDEEEAAL